MAVGLTLKKENLPEFKRSINEYIKSLDIQTIQPILDIDMEIKLKDLSIGEILELKKLEPYGEANKVPIFAIKNLKIQSIRSITDGKHIKLQLSDNNLVVDAIGFNLGEYAEHYKIGEKVDIVGSVEINSYNGLDSIQINIKDIMKSL